jgi:cobalamin synthase
MSPRNTNRPPRANGRIDPATGLPIPPDIEDAPQRDWRIRSIGLVAALFIAVAAMIYFLGDQEFSPLVTTLVVLAGLAAITQSVLVLLEFRRK